MAEYADLGDYEEDKRIAIIGKLVTETGKTAAIITDDEPGKPERYIKKITERFPLVMVLDQFKGPVAKSVTIKVGRKPT
jgi:hypothetical protein